MEDKVGYPLKERQNVVNKIFGKDGVTDSQDNDTFEIRLENVREMVKSLDKNVTGKPYLDYLNNKLVPLIKEHVIKPFRQNKVPHNWTSNNAESANHILKTHTQWKLNGMPEFVEQWTGIVVGERKERERAIRNMGNFKLASTHIHHDIPITTWASLPNDKQDAKLRRLRADPGKTTNTTTSTTNGLRTVMNTPSAGKKLNQVKRKRAERSRTPSTKRNRTTE